MSAEQIVCELFEFYQWEIIPDKVTTAEGGVLQGSCRVSRVFKLLFSLPAAPSLG